MKRNVPELEATLQHIKDNPEEWNQTTWQCGTSACFAGRVAANHDAWVTWEDYANNASDYLRKGLPRYACRYDAPLRTKEGNLTTVREFAAEKLGLTTQEADLLFAERNGLNELEFIVKGLVNGDSFEFIESGLDFDA